MKIDKEIQKEHSNIQSQIFYFLSKAFCYPWKSPDENGTLDAVLKLAADLGINPKQPIEIDEKTAQAEYTRLFVNAPTGVPCPPYSSVYLFGSGILMQKGHEEAFSFYKQAGITPDTGSEPEDHISTELAFVAHLIEQNNLDLLSRFLSQHLLKWYPTFLKRLASASPHPYYELLGRLTWLFLQNLSQEDSHGQTTVS